MRLPELSFFGSAPVLFLEQEGEDQVETAAAESEDSLIPATVTQISCYLMISFLFIYALNRFTSVADAKKGLYFVFFATVFAIIITFFTPDWDQDDAFKFLVAFSLGAILGTILGLKVKMIHMSKTVSLINCLIGLSAGCLSLSYYFMFFYWDQEITGTDAFQSCVVTVMSGTLIAATVQIYIKSEKITLNDEIQTFFNQYQTIINLSVIGGIIFLGFLYICFKWGFVLFLVGLASLWLGWSFLYGLNKREIVIVNAFFLAYSGYLVAFVGFMSNSYMVLIVGALVGTSGYIFLESLKKHIKTSVLDVILGRTKPPRNISKSEFKSLPIQRITRDDAFADLMVSNSIVIVPGPGLIDSASHRNIGILAQHLKSIDKRVRFAIHPCSSLTPGQMTAVLAEAGNELALIEEFDKVDFCNTDLVFVVGLDEFTNSDALDNKNSDFYGQTVVPVWQARKVIFLQTGEEDTQNPVLYKENVFLLGANNTKEQIQYLISQFIKKGVFEMNQEEREYFYRNLESGVSTNEFNEEVEDLAPFLSACRLTIGVPLETEDNRVALAPIVVKSLIKIGFKILVERGAGLEAGLADDKFQELGAEIVESTVVWERSDIMLTVNSPKIDDLRKSKNIKVLCQLEPLSCPEFCFQVQREFPNLKVFSLARAENLPDAITSSLRERAELISPCKNQLEVTCYRKMIEILTKLPKIVSKQIFPGLRLKEVQALIVGCDAFALKSVAYLTKFGVRTSILDLEGKNRELIRRAGAICLEVQELEEEKEKFEGLDEEEEIFCPQVLDKSDPQAKCKQAILNHIQKVNILIFTPKIAGDYVSILDEQIVKSLNDQSVLAYFQEEAPPFNFQNINQNIQCVEIQLQAVHSLMPNQESIMNAFNFYYFISELIGLHNNQRNSAANFNSKLDNDLKRHLCNINEGKLLALKTEFHQEIEKQVKEEDAEIENKDVLIEEKKKLMEELSQKQQRFQVYQESGQQLIDIYFSKNQQESIKKYQIIFLCLSNPALTGCYWSCLWLVIVITVGGLFDMSFIVQLGCFGLACIVAYILIERIPFYLNLPLISLVSGGLAGIIVISCMLMMCKGTGVQIHQDFWRFYSFMAFVGLFFSAFALSLGQVSCCKMLEFMKVKEEEKADVTLVDVNQLEN